MRDEVGIDIDEKTLTDAELLVCLRRHMHPVSADIYKIDDVLKSAYDGLAVISKSYEEKDLQEIENWIDVWY